MAGIADFRLFLCRGEASRLDSQSAAHVFFTIARLLDGQQAQQATSTSTSDTSRTYLVSRWLALRDIYPST